MSSTEAAGPAAQPSVKARPPISLTEFLVLLSGAADAAKITIRQLTVNGLISETFLDLGAGEDVGRLLDELGKPRLDIDVQHQSDIGVIVTSYDGFWMGWKLYVQHVQSTPTIQEGTTPA